MKTPSKLSIFAICTILGIVISSCQKHDNVTPPLSAKGIFEHVIVKNGVLHFDSAGSVPLVVEALLKMNENERRSWEKANGFTSMYTLISDVHHALNQCTSKSEFDRTLASNGDIVHLVGDEVRQLILLDYFTIITNRQGIYYVGQALVKITPTSKIIVFSGNRSKLKNMESMLKSANVNDTSEVVFHVSEDVVISNYIAASKLKAENYPDAGPYLYADRVNSDGDRKVKFWIIPWRDHWLNHPCDEFWQWRVEVKIENQTKRFGAWNFYTTTCYWEKTDIQMYMPVEQPFKFKECGGGTYPYDPYYWAPYVIANYSWSSGGTEVERHSEMLTVGSIIQNNPLPLPTIINARGRATNRGMGKQFAVICEGGFKATNNCLPSNEN